MLKRYGQSLDLIFLFNPTAFPCRIPVNHKLSISGHMCFSLHTTF